MTDARETKVGLALLAQSCSTALLAARRSTPPDPLHLVLADLDALLVLIYDLSTKLSIALEPTAPSYSAAIPVLHDLTQRTSALLHATNRLHDTLHGATLVRVVTSRITDIIHALRALVQAFLNNAAGGPYTQEYLVRTGTLHDLITAARSPSGIPKDNRAAVCLYWKSDKDSLEDNLQELTRMINDAESDHPPDTTFDDGWDDIGLGHTTAMDEHELARAKNVRQILRLTTLLHKRIFLDLLQYPSSAPISALDSLLLQSNLLLSTSDDLVAALYTSQHPAHACKHVLELVDIATALQTQLPLFLPAADELANQLHALAIQDPTPSPMTKKRADKKWFDTCVHQIVHLSTTLTESSTQTEDPNGAT